MSARPGKPRVRVHTDGRISFPGVVSYRRGDGTESPFPPSDVPFHIVIADHPAYERLAQTSLLYHRLHIGSASEATDNRPTS